MSKISLDLSSIKSAGIYTIEIDETQRTEQQITALRLLVGFNGKGPFNRPVFLQTEAQRQKLFGDIDPQLEKKGCYFNRSAKTMLENSPILALNLLKVDDSIDGPDQVNYVAMSLDAAKPNPKVSDPGKVYGEVDYLAESVDNKIYGTVKGAPIPFVGKTPYSSLYDRSRFWTPSEVNLLQVASAGLGTASATGFEKTNFLNFANLGTDEISILVFKPEGFTGYDITAKEWYGGEKNIPFGWIRPSDFISDYFIRVVAVKGNWSNYPILSSDSSWGKYFDKKGIIKERIFDFSQAEGITYVGSWTGVIIPDFVDKRGNYLYIKDRVNSQTESTGLLMSVNEDAMQVISYDLNGVDVERGQANGTGTWIYDYDANAEGDSDAGETAIDENGFIVDMVGHGFQNGLAREKKMKELKNAYNANWFAKGTTSLDTSVYYIDTLDTSTITKKAHILVPETKASGSKQKPVYFWDVTNAALGSTGCYVKLTDTEKASTTTDAQIIALEAYDAEFKDAGKNVGAFLDDEGIEKKKLSLQKAKQSETEEEVPFGNYASYNTTTNELYIFSVTSGDEQDLINDEDIRDMKDVVETTIEVDSTSSNDSITVVPFTYNAKTYYVPKSAGKPFYT